MSEGLYVRRWHPFTGTTREPITSERCWKCDRPNPDLAHAVMEYVAAVLGAELKRRVVAAIAEHREHHHCGREFNHPLWHYGCGEVGDLLAMLPDAMLPVAIG